LSTVHARKSFSSGSAPLDRYLHDLATQDIKRRVSNCFVALDDAGVIAGYYTLAAASFPLTELRSSSAKRDSAAEELSAEETKRLPRYAVLPAGLIGRLAVDRRFRGKRRGGALVMDATVRAARAEPAIFALVVDAKDEKAAGFYQHLGFRRFTSKPASLFLPIATALQALNTNSK
jgi:GNAT superfamily N-acetyltransferase